MVHRQAPRTVWKSRSFDGACRVTSWSTSSTPTRDHGWIGGVRKEDLIKKKKTRKSAPASRTPEERTHKWHRAHPYHLSLFVVCCPSPPSSHGKMAEMVAPDVVAHPFRGLGLTNQPDEKRAAIFFCRGIMLSCFFFCLMH